MRRALLVAIALLAVVPPLDATCQFECRSYANGDKYCWEWLSGRATASMSSCEVIAFCYTGADGTQWCELQCEGQQCYLA